MSVSQELVDWCHDLTLPQVYSLDQVLNMLPKMQAELSDIQNVDWSTRVKHQKVLAGLALICGDGDDTWLPVSEDQQLVQSELSRAFPTAQDRSEQWASCWDQLQTGVCLQLSDLRSAVQRECCNVLQAVLQWVPQHHRDAFSESCVPSLQKVCAGTVHVMVSAAETVLYSMVQHSRLGKSGFGQVHALLGGKSSSVHTRRICCQTLAISMLSHGPGGHVERNVAALEAVLKERVSDRDGNVRSVARKLCKVYMYVQPTRALYIEKVLEGSVQRAIQQQSLPTQDDVMGVEGCSTRGGSAVSSSSSSRPSTGGSRQSMSSSSTSGGNSSTSNVSRQSTTSRPSTRESISTLRQQAKLNATPTKEIQVSIQVPHHQPQPIITQPLAPQQQQQPQHIVQPPVVMQPLMKPSKPTIISSSSSAASLIRPSSGGIPSVEGLQYSHHLHSNDYTAAPPPPAAASNNNHRISAPQMVSRKPTVNITNNNIINNNVGVTSNNVSNLNNQHMSNQHVSNNNNQYSNANNNLQSNLSTKPQSAYGYSLANTTNSNATTTSNNTTKSTNTNRLSTTNVQYGYVGMNTSNNTVNTAPVTTPTTNNIATTATTITAPARISNVPAALSHTITNNNNNNNNTSTVSSKKRELTIALTQCAATSRAVGISAEAKLLPWNSALQLLESILRSCNGGSQVQTQIDAVGVKTLLKLAHITKLQLRLETFTRVSETLITCLSVLGGAACHDHQKGVFPVLDAATDSMLTHTLVELVAGLVVVFASPKSALRRQATDAVNVLTNGLDERLLLRVCLSVLCDEVVRASGAELHAWELVDFVLSSDTDTPTKVFCEHQCAYAGYLQLLAEELCTETRALRRVDRSVDPQENACVLCVKKMVQLAPNKLCNVLKGVYALQVPENLMDLSQKGNVTVCKGPMQNLLATLKEVDSVFHKYVVDWRGTDAELAQHHATNLNITSAIQLSSAWETDEDDIAATAHSNTAATTNTSTAVATTNTSTAVATTNTNTNTNTHTYSTLTRAVSSNNHNNHNSISNSQPTLPSTTTMNDDIPSLLHNMQHLSISTPPAMKQLPPGVLSTTLRVELFQTFDCLHKVQDERSNTSNIPPGSYTSHAYSTIHSPHTPQVTSGDNSPQPQLDCSVDSIQAQRSRLYEQPLSLLHVERTDVADRELAKAQLRSQASTLDTSTARSLFASEAGSQQARHLFINQQCPPRGSVPSTQPILHPLALTRNDTPLTEPLELWENYPPASVALLEQCLVSLAKYVPPLLVLDAALTVIALNGFNLTIGTGGVELGAGVSILYNAATGTSSLQCKPQIGMNILLPIKCALKLTAAMAEQQRAIPNDPVLRTALGTLLKLSTILLSNANAIVRKESIQTLITLEPIVNTELLQDTLATLNPAQLKLLEIYKAKKAPDAYTFNHNTTLINK